MQAVLLVPMAAFSCPCLLLSSLRLRRERPQGNTDAEYSMGFAFLTGHLLPPFLPPPSLSASLQSLLCFSLLAWQSWIQCSAAAAVGVFGADESVQVKERIGTLSKGRSG